MTFGRVVAELPVPVEAPRPERAVGLQRQRMPLETTGKHRHDAIQVHHLDRARVIGGRAVTELAICVSSPGPDRAVTLQRDGVTLARAYRRPVRLRADLYRSRVTCGRAIAQIAGTVEAPRPERAVGFERKGLVVVCSHRPPVRR